MREDIDKERKFMMKAWAKREAQVSAMIEATVGMVGDLHGIVGQAMPETSAIDEPPMIEGKAAYGLIGSNSDLGIRERACHQPIRHLFLLRRFVELHEPSYLSPPQADCCDKIPTAYETAKHQDDGSRR